MLKINNPESVLKILDNDAEKISNYAYKKLLCFRALINGHKTLDVCRMFLVPRRTLNDWVIGWNSTGFESLEKKSPTGRNSRLSKENLEVIIDEFGKRDAFYSEDVKDFISERFGIEFSLNWIEIFMKKKLNLIPHRLKKADN